jgi:hypothetical protein
VAPTSPPSTPDYDNYYPEAYFSFPARSGFGNGGHTDRSYRHPFLTNAIAGTSAPLRQWFESFFRRFANRQAYYGLEHVPTPSRLYLDVEPTIMWAGSQTEVNELPSNTQPGSSNCIYMLEQLYASRGASWAYNFWDNSANPLPGDPDGYTLKQRYMADAAAFGLPVASGEPDPEHATTGWQSKLANTNQDPLSGASDRNRKFSIWYAQIASRAIEAVIKNCFYNVVEYGLPASGSEPAVNAWPDCKVGNYASTLQDGAMAPMGIIFDSTCVGGACTSSNNDYNALRRFATAGCSATGDSIPYEQPYPSTHDWTNSVPRAGRFPDLDGGLFWHLNPSQTGEVFDHPTKRWGAVQQTSSGSVDSPVLYPLFARNYQYLRTRQPNPYAPKVTGTFCGVGSVTNNIVETYAETTLRTKRFDAECALGGYLAAGERPLVPWIGTCGFQYKDTSYFPAQYFTVSVPEYA